MMLNRTWLVLAAILAVVSLVLHQSTLLALALMFLLVQMVVYLWSWFSLKSVVYARRLSCDRSFIGEEITYEISIENRKIIPLLWLDIKEDFDDGLMFLAGKPATSSVPGKKTLHSLLSLGWYQKVTRFYPVRCTKRGYFKFEPAVISSGDIFGFAKQAKAIDAPIYIMVYPKILPLTQLGIPSQDLFGDISIRRHLFYDPVRAFSARDYVSGDPVNRIHWKATAHLQRLQSKVFEHTTTINIALFTDVRTVHPPLWGEYTHLLETAITTTASIASQALANGYHVGLYVNQPPHDGWELIKLPPSNHPEQMRRILDALAQLVTPETLPMDKMLTQVAGTLPLTCTITVVTAAPTEVLLRTLRNLRQIGRPVSLILIGGDKPALALEGIQLFHVVADTTWEETRTITVNPPLG